VNAQGEDVVAGIRTPEDLDAMKAQMPQAYEELVENCNILEPEKRHVSRACPLPGDELPRVTVDPPVAPRRAALPDLGAAALPTRKYESVEESNFEEFMDIRCWCSKYFCTAIKDVQVHGFKWLWG